MILGLSTGAFTALHVAISLIALLAGLYVVVQMLRERIEGLPNAVFLAFTIATSGSGFLFHSKAFGPPHAVGVLSLLILALAVFALYGGKLRGAWRTVYVAAAVAALYLNAFVAIVQAFAKTPVLKTLAPTQTEPPFVIAQVLALLAFIVLGVAAARRGPSVSAHLRP